MRIRRGIPETLRHHVWLRLASPTATPGSIRGNGEKDLVELFPHLLSQEPKSTEELSNLKVVYSPHLAYRRHLVHQILLKIHIKSKPLARGLFMGDPLNLI